MDDVPWLPRVYIREYDIYMRHVNALKIRQSLGQILDELDRGGEPILVEKARQPRAVLVPLKLFRERFVDKTVYEERRALERWFEESYRSKLATREGPDAVALVRQLRGSLP